MTPSTDHAPNRMTWISYSRSEDVRSAIAPHKNIKGLNAIHISPDRRDFHLEPIRCCTGAITTDTFHPSASTSSHSLSVYSSGPNPLVQEPHCKQVNPHPADRC